MLGYLPKYRQKPNQVHPLLRDDLLKCEKYSRQIRLLGKYEIISKQELNFFIERKEMEKEELTDERGRLHRKSRREIPEDEIRRIQEQINTINEKLKTIRAELRLAKDIEQHADTMEEKLKQVETDKEKEMKMR